MPVRDCERGKRFIVFKPEIERTRRKEEEGRKRERPYKKGEMVFEKRRVGRERGREGETAAKSEMEGRR